MCFNTFLVEIMCHVTELFAVYWEVKVLMAFTFLLHQASHRVTVP